eukprot:TRINITY_DN774007_c0_g1_i1.p1 TRINITY_DN774007_c0_g1~~TRINITY_DN774007_c0_g1_i1.p1  ORF type:complete len:193 (-),score=59.05 TRINITY_DN774007_c0_g1_i1:122-700(-)
MFLLDWFKSLLFSLGLYKKEAKILFLGLDNAGKTTLLSLLKSDRVEIPEPTLHPNSEELVLGKNKLRTFDLGGHEPARLLWSRYYPETDGIVFMVDAADPHRFPESKKELDRILTNDELSKVPIVVLGNKIDDPAAVDEMALRRSMGLITTSGQGAIGDIKAGDRRPLELFMCCVAKRMGYSDGIKWLSNFL